MVRATPSTMIHQMYLDDEIEILRFRKQRHNPSLADSISTSLIMVFTYLSNIIRQLPVITVTARLPACESARDEPVGCASQAECA